MSQTPTTKGSSRGSEAERVRATQPEGTERTRELPVYVPRVDIIETEDALEVQGQRMRSAGSARGAP